MPCFGISLFAGLLAGSKPSGTENFQGVKGFNALPFRASLVSLVGGLGFREIPDYAYGFGSLGLSEALRCFGFWL